MNKQDATKLQVELEKEKKSSAFHFNRANESEQGKWKMAMDAANNDWKLNLIALIANGQQVEAIKMVAAGPTMALAIETHFSYAGGKWSREDKTAALGEGDPNAKPKAA